MTITESITIMKAMADSSRLMILNGLMEKPQYVEELSQRFGLAASTVSFHLKKLEAAGLVSKSREQYYTVYELNEELFGLSLRQLSEFDNIEQFVQDERITQYRGKIISTFFDGKRLRKMPTQRKKRLIVLEVFADKFAAGRQYGECEVDAVLTESFDDYCALRRALIDEGMLMRRNGTYWRPVESDREHTREPRHM